ncbi:MAG: Rieske (2Fe-2S) protein, partial [Acidobacteria bacterium]|nr:Rieske (2Fe-2S) protein [Acidobacteriota bacterium]
MSTAPAATEKAPTAASASIEPAVLRRRIVWGIVWGFVAALGLMVMRFFFPRTLFEPKTIFTIGTAADFGLGVETKFQQDFRVWVVKKPDRLFVIYARCTHLGCTPDWKLGEN